MCRTRADALTWRTDEVEQVVRAARRAPLYGGGHPWVLEPHGHSVSLYELPHHTIHDRLGVGRLLTCGAVLHNVHTALRAAGWRVEVTLPGDVDRPDLLAVLTAVEHSAPTPQEVLDHQALTGPGMPGSPELSVLIAADRWPGTRVRVVDSAAEPMVAALPAGSTGLLVSTDGDSRKDVLCAGAALQAVRLRARALGVQTCGVRGPLHGLPGHRWALLGVRGLSGPNPEE
ncbi:hypothetical protein ACFFQW_46650 [Umezawaea endophytica]|uniref:Uncharacterized protein n=1 Tax=Umezawaea endophytica TaxID=1654476 RepID=A0A9X3AJ89_9PSEU|nr:hypothetical protein [Umezawaea endophytica]MCS7483691.1 hypothetical protein [Umezawaea endophytica]